MKNFQGQAGKRPKFAIVHDHPHGLPDHSSCAGATMELVQVSPDEFLRLERLGKRRKRKITLPHISILEPKPGE
jgi:LmbE family N-acetylglucosaminyl deacetylase